MSVELVGFDSAMAHLKKRQQELDRNQSKGLREAAKPIAATMRSMAPKGRTSRDLRAFRKAKKATPSLSVHKTLASSVRIRVYADAAGKRVRIKSESPVAHLVIRGARAHVEVAKNARVMQLKDGGYYARVNHPGIRHTDPFVDRAIEATTGIARATFTEEQFSGS